MWLVTWVSLCLSGVGLHLYPGWLSNCLGTDIHTLLVAIEVFGWPWADCGWTQACNCGGGKLKNCQPPEN